jgi:hypothetical protein
MKTSRGTLVPEAEFYCTTLREAARLLNVVGLLARVYGCPEPRRFLGILGRSLGGANDASPPRFRPREGRDRLGS